MTKKGEILVTVGTWDKNNHSFINTTGVTYGYQVPSTTKYYQVPTEGACSLNPVNTVYFTVQYTLALSWITP